MTCSLEHPGSRNPSPCRSRRERGDVAEHQTRRPRCAQHTPRPAPAARTPARSGKAPGRGAVDTGGLPTSPSTHRKARLLVGSMIRSCLLPADPKCRSVARHAARSTRSGPVARDNVFTVRTYATDENPTARLSRTASPAAVSPTFHVDKDGRTDPRINRSTSEPNLRCGTLAAEVAHEPAPVVRVSNPPSAQGQSNHRLWGRGRGISSRRRPCLCAGDS